MNITINEIIKKTCFNCNELISMSSCNCQYIAFCNTETFYINLANNRIAISTIHKEIFKIYILNQLHIFSYIFDVDPNSTINNLIEKIEIYTTFQ